MAGIIIGVLEQGFIYAIMALGVYITYSILDFPDLSVDGTFPLGAAVAVLVILNGGNPWLALLAAFAAGALAGLVTGLIHVKLKVKDLLSGIIMMVALYTINLRVAGKSNVPIFSEGTVFNSGLAGLLPEGLLPYATVIFSFLIVLVMKFLLDWYLSTRSGFLLRCAGDNPALVTQQGRNVGNVKILGLALANGLAALSGAVLCQQFRYFDVSMGPGTIVIGLASVIIGVNCFKRVRFLKPTTAVIIGSVFYKGCVSAAVEIGFEPMDMKLITAVLFLVVLVLQNLVFRKGGRQDA